MRIYLVNFHYLLEFEGPWKEAALSFSHLTLVQSGNFLYLSEYKPFI